MVQADCRFLSSIRLIGLRERGVLPKRGSSPATRIYWRGVSDREAYHTVDFHPRSGRRAWKLLLIDSEREPTAILAEEARLCGPALDVSPQTAEAPKNAEVVEGLEQLVKGDSTWLEERRTN